MIDWPVKTLGEVCDFVRGVTYDKADARSEMKDGFIPLLRATNITENGILNEGHVFVPKKGVRADQKLMSGDALITIASGSASVVGRSVLVEDPGEITFGAFCGVLRPGSEILPRYLSHFLSSRTVRTAWSEAAQGTNINNLKRDDILQTECLVPPLDEQKRIVALLDDATARVTELTACYEQARSHANDLFTSALRDALEGNPDWPVKTLGDLVTVQNGYAFDSKYFSSLGKIGLIRIRDLKNGVDTETRYDGPFGTEYEVSAGDYLIGMDGEFRCYEWKGEPALLNQRVCRLQGFSASLESRFLFYGINKFLKDIEDVTGYTTVKHLSSKSILGIQMPVPPLEEQKWIVARLDQLRAKSLEMVTAYDAKLQAAKNLRQSILEAAFAGEL
jgi:restriction endonuclease S subunit